MIPMRRDDFENMIHGAIIDDLIWKEKCCEIKNAFELSKTLRELIGDRFQTKTGFIDTADDTPKGYYTKAEVTAATEGLCGLVELIKRSGVWEHAFPPHDKAEIRIATADDYKYENVSYQQIEEGFEYLNTAGGRIKIISVEDALDYPMPKRWGAGR